MPRRRRQQGGARARQMMLYGDPIGFVPQAGGGIFDFLKPVGNFIKDNKLISQGLSFVPGLGGLAGRVVAGQLGVGRRRPRLTRVIRI